MFQKSIPRHALSKSTFMYGVQCTKRLWLHKNLPKEREVASELQTRIFQQGTDIGLLAQQLFPGGINAEPENYYSWQKSVTDTMRYIRNGHQVIYEAAFQFEGILCAVDLLVNINNKWYAYEVKSTTSLKSAHILDAALQYFVLTNAGIDLADFSIIHLNKNYIRQGDLDISLLFNPTSVLKEVLELQYFISSTSVELLEVLSKNAPPDREVGEHCTLPYPCDFQMFCNKGILPAGTNMQSLIDQKLLSTFANKLHFPLSFLALQTWSSAVPLLDGHWPYKQVCFQFSIHQQTEPGGVLKHHFFLEEDIHSGQEKLLKNLLEVAGEAGSIIVHHDSFVKFLLQQLKKEFPFLDKQISSLQNRVIEMPSPFGKDSLPEEEIENDLLQEETVNGFSIKDSSSAAAAFINLESQTTKKYRIEMSEALFFYAHRSSLDLAMKIQRWQLI